MHPTIDIVFMQSTDEISGKTLASESITCAEQKDEKMDEEWGEGGGDKELDDETEEEETVGQKDEAGEVEEEDEQNADTNPPSSFELRSSEIAAGEEHREFERKFCCDRCC